MCIRFSMVYMLGILVFSITVLLNNYVLTGDVYNVSEAARVSVIELPVKFQDSLPYREVLITHTL